MRDAGYEQRARTAQGRPGDAAGDPAGGSSGCGHGSADCGGAAERKVFVLEFTPAQVVQWVTTVPPVMSRPMADVFGLGVGHGLQGQG